MDKVFRVFISSTRTLLEEERKEVVDSILETNNLPISMERFASPNNLPPISVVMQYLDMSDVVFLIIGHIYGRIIPNLNKAKCPISDVCSACSACNSSGCVISYTHFEYLYSCRENKVLYCFKLNDFDDEDTFRNTLRRKGITDKNKIESIVDKFEKGINGNREFVQGINEGFIRSFSDDVGLVRRLTSALIGMKSNRGLDGRGLIEVGKEDIVKSLTFVRGDPDRSKKFNEFEGNIARGLDVYSLGMTGLGGRLDWIKDEVSGGKEINLCMIDPSLLSENLQDLNSTGVTGMNDLLGECNFQIEESHFHSYSGNQITSEEILKSYRELKGLVEEIKVENVAKGKITLRTIKSFLPMSVYIKEMGTGDAELLAEFWLPFTGKRTIVEVNKVTSPDLFNSLITFYERILKKSDVVIASK